MPKRWTEERFGPGSAGNVSKSVRQFMRIETSRLAEELRKWKKLKLFIAHLTPISEGNVADVTIAQQLKLPKGSLIVMDRGYNDYKLFERWSAEDVGFVTRMKKNADWYNREHRPVKEGSIVRRDTLGEFNCLQAGRKIKGTYRRVIVWLEDKEQELVLLTNRFDLAAETIAEIYKQRWQIELFFKAIKQNLRIKTFVGTSANAVRIQIWTALISMLLLKLLQFRSHVKWALSNLVALLRWNLFTHKDLWKWIDHPFPALTNPPPDGEIQPELDGMVPS